MLKWSRESSDMPVVCFRPVYIDLIDWAFGVSGAGQILGIAPEELQINEGESTLNQVHYT